MKTKNIFLSLLCLCLSTLTNAQQMDQITFSAAASSVDGFQPVAGVAYGASMAGSGGSLEVSAAYGQNNFAPSTLQVEAMELQNCVSLFPNPVQHCVHVNLCELGTGEKTIHIYDAMGRLCLTQLTTAEVIDIDLSSFANGSYQLKIFANESFYSFNIIKTQ